MCIQDRFEEIYRIMLESFPSPELRRKEDQLALLKDPRYRVLTAEGEGGKIAGFLACWVLPSCVFIEHLAVDPSLRGAGTGGKLVRRCLEEADGPVFLEVEIPHDGISTRRVGFYERLGFHMTGIRYLQPKLKEGDDDLPLAIMSAPNRCDEGEFAPYKEEIFQMVYRQADSGRPI